MTFWYSIAIAFLVGVLVWVLVLTISSRILRYRARANSCRWRIAQDLRNSRWSLAIGLAAPSVLVRTVLAAGFTPELLWRAKFWVIVWRILGLFAICTFLWVVLLAVLSFILKLRATPHTLRWRAANRVKTSRCAAALLLACPTYFVMVTNLSRVRDTGPWPGAAWTLNECSLLGAERVTPEILY